MEIECLISAIFYGVLFAHSRCRNNGIWDPSPKVSCRNKSSRSEATWRVATHREVEKGTCPTITASSTSRCDTI
jgi:hypothetical protein